MTTNERDTHFQEYANLLFPEVSKLFFTMYARILEHRQIEEIDAIEDEIRTLIAQRAYDLVLHALSNVDTYDLGYLPQSDYERHIMPAIPDLTEWPTPSPQWP